MKIESVAVYRYTIPLKTPFRISAGVIREKEGLIVELHADGLTGWGEASVDAVPFYSHETTGSAEDLYRRVLLPLTVGTHLDTPDELVQVMDKYRGGAFAKAGLEAAFWDVYGKKCGQSVASLLGGVRDTVECGPSIGIKSTPSETVATVAEKLAQGWRRIKLKVMPGFDTQYIAAVRAEFPDISLMVDANNAYGENDFDLLASWDRFHLLMVEQPLCEEDIYFHSLLKKRMSTPICLDESVHTYHDAQTVVALHAADIVNVKICRVGGLVKARRMVELCRANGIRNWIGSRVGSGVADAPRLAAAAMDNCVLPSDCVISGMYMSDDLLAEPYERNGCFVKGKTAPGLGIDVDRAKLAKYAVQVI